MTEQKAIVHLVTDLATGKPFALMLDQQGSFVGVQPLNLAFQTLDGRTLHKFTTPAIGGGDDDGFPYGATTSAIEYTGGRAAPQIFTIRWPTLEEAMKNVLPEVASWDAPADAVAAGLAPPVKSEVAAHHRIGFNAVADVPHVHLARPIGFRSLSASPN